VYQKEFRRTIDNLNKALRRYEQTGARGDKDSHWRRTGAIRFKRALEASALARRHGGWKASVGDGITVMRGALASSTHPNHVLPSKTTMSPVVQSIRREPSAPRELPFLAGLCCFACSNDKFAQTPLSTIHNLISPKFECFQPSNTSNAHDLTTRHSPKFL